MRYPLSSYWILISTAGFALSTAVDASQISPQIYGTYGKRKDLGTAEIGNRQVRILTRARWGGAISELWYGGKQFVNTADHGRQIQTAWSLNSLGECLNPTEAGSASDGRRSTSSSELLIFEVTPGKIKSTAHPAFWLTAGQSSVACPPQTSSSLTRPQTDQTLTRELQLGVNGDPQIFSVEAKLKFPTAVQATQVEALTAYLLKDFTVFEKLQDDGTLVPQEIKTNPADPRLKDHVQMVPIVISTPDQKYALGAIGADAFGLPASYYSFQYGPAPDGTSKWSVIFRTGALRAGEYPFKVYAFVGTREEVREKMNRFLKDSPSAARAKILQHPGVVYDPTYYKEKYADLRALYKDDADAYEYHFFNYGIHEGRQGSATLFVPDYLASHPDLKTLCGERGYGCALAAYLRSL